MVFKVSPWVGVGAVLVAAVVIDARPALAAPPTAKAVEGEGCIRQGEGECKPVAVGATLQVQGSFQAGKGGATLQFNDQTLVKLTEGAEVRLLPRTKVQLSANDETASQVIDIRKGKIFVTLAGGGVKSAMMVKAPHQHTAIVKAGTSVIRRLDDGLVLGALSGGALMATENDWSEVHAGKLRVLKKGEPKGTERSLIAAPTMKPHRSVLLIVGGKRAEEPRVSWQPIEGAAAYEVEVRANGGPPSVRRVEAAKTELVLPELGPGQHAVAVRAIDHEELESPWAPTDRFTIATVSLPKGALFVNGGVIQLPEGQKVSLSDVDGLETAINEMDTFMAPPRELGLLAGKAQTLRFRRKGEADELTVRLEPRSIEAVVSLSPRNAQWPRDPIDITVQLTSPGARTPLDGIDMVPKVLVDIEPVTLTWERQGAFMKARVQPRGDGKPHTVRVEVNDQHGFYLGRNFTEVEAAPPPR